MAARMTRRTVLALAATASAGAPAPAVAGMADLREALRKILPAGLEPDTLGHALLADNPEVGDRMACLVRAAAPSGSHGWQWVPAQVQDDFAAARIIGVAGWQLSMTEAWLSAALCCPA